MEKIAPFPGGGKSVESCNVYGCHGFFQPRKVRSELLLRVTFDPFCPEIRAFTGSWGEISSTVSKVLSDRKVLFKHKNGC